MIKNIFRWVFYIVLIALFIIALTMLAIRFIVYPNIDQYKDDVGQYVSKNLGQTVNIGEIITGWDGVSPHIALKKIDVLDAEKRVALHLNHVEANVSWLSIPMLQLKLSNLIVHEPALTIRRKPDGRIFLAGIDISGKSNPAFSNWLLRQRQIRIINAQLNWFDDLRQAPVLSLNQLNLNLTNPAINSSFGQHQFALSAIPSTGTPQVVKVSGVFVGGNVKQAHTWHGKLTGQFKNTDISLWKPWIDYPLDLKSGVGNAQIALDFADHKIEYVKINTALTNLSLKLKTPEKGQERSKNKSNEKYLLASRFSGEITWSDLKNSQTLRAKQIKLAMPIGLNINNGSGYYVASIKNAKPWLSAELNLDQFDLSLVNQLSPYLNLPLNVVSTLNGLAPVGELSNLKLSWSGAQAKPNNYAIKTDFSQLGLNAYKKIPGVSNLSGVLLANQAGGELIIKSKKIMVNFKDILRRPIPANLLTGNVKWIYKDNNLNVEATKIFITSPHLTGTVNAKYSVKAGKDAYLDLTGKFSKGDVQHASFYYPAMFGEQTLRWLDTSIKKGVLKDVDMRIKGNLANFPFVNKNKQTDSKLELFKVSAQLSNATLDYGTGWPAIEGMNLSMLFTGTRMELSANAGNMLGNKIIKSSAVIKQLDAQNPLLTIVSEVHGNIADGIKYVNNSPIKSSTQGFTDSLLTAGKGHLLLTLNIPLKNVDSTKIAGAYKVSNGIIYANEQIGLPELNNINGTLNFTESNINAQNISAEAFGSPAKFSLKMQANKAIVISAYGRINDASIKKLAPNIVTSSLQGSADWSSEISIRAPLVDVNLKSNLVGMAINLPAPFNKAANEVMLLSVDKKQMSLYKDSITLNLGKLVSANILRATPANDLVIERGDIGINVPAITPLTPGLSVRAKLDSVNADDWIALLDGPESVLSTNKTPTTSYVINKTDLAIQKLTIFGRRINALKLRAESNNAGYKMAINSLEMTGDAQWQLKQNNQSYGKIIARFKNLTVPKAINTAANIETKEDIKKEVKKPDFKKPEFKKQLQEYPALNIVADNFEVGGKKLGALNLNAFENGEDWVIQKLNITNDDSTLDLQGNWHNWARNPNTDLRVSLSSVNIGKTFKRFGQPDVLKAGAADLSGQLKWAGSPHDYDATQLSGNMTLLATKGQILKVKPGVGRLFGLLTLQSLPRRLSLDFRDLFNEGFAYDTISATAKIDNGILRSDNFVMDGPAAKATIKGETNLKTETVNLKVQVLPHISDTLSLAALAGGPIVGAVAFVAQKILKDPFNKIVGSQYSIAGTWDNPIEVKSEKENIGPSSNSPLTQ